MNQFSPLLSVIIPTRNREQYAIDAINSILSYHKDAFEIVIQDNSDTNMLEDYILTNLQSQVAGGAIKYAHVPYKLSFVENFNQAVEKATGEYLCLIGDDDGVNPEIEYLVQWAKSNGIDAIVPGLQAQYIWPGVNIESAVSKLEGATLSVLNFEGQIKKYDANSELLKLIKNGGQDYLNFGLPKLYHGIVKRECMNRIKNSYGQYFGGLTPDVYIVVMLAKVIDTVIYLDYPLTIPGACIKSGSIDSRNGNHTGELKNAPHLVGHEDYKWADEIPAFYSVETIWAETIIKALEDSNSQDLKKEFNISRTAAYCLFRHRKYKDIILRNYFKAEKARGKNQFIASADLLAAFLNGPLKGFVLRAARRILRKPVTRYKNVENISEASLKLTEFLKERNINIVNILMK